MKPVPPSDLWAQMDALVGALHPPEGAFTLQAMAERYRVTREQARGMVNRFIEQGTAEACGKFNGQNFFRLK